MASTSPVFTFIMTQPTFSAPLPDVKESFCSSLNCFKYFSTIICRLASMVVWRS